MSATSSSASPTAGSTGTRRVDGVRRAAHSHAAWGMRSSIQTTGRPPTDDATTESFSTLPLVATVKVRCGTERSHGTSWAKSRDAVSFHPVAKQIASRGEALQEMREIVPHDHVSADSFDQEQVIRVSRSRHGFFDIEHSVDVEENERTTRIHPGSVHRSWTRCSSETGPVQAPYGALMAWASVAK